jgi:hypothetical protein
MTDAAYEQVRNDSITHLQTQRGDARELLREHNKRGREPERARAVRGDRIFAEVGCGVGFERTTFRL